MQRERVPKTSPRRAPPPGRSLAPRSVPKQERAVATFEAILDAAASLLARGGLAAMTTNHVADRAGVNIGSLYRYFASKEAIVAALVDRALETYEASMNLAFAVALDLSLHDGFDALVRAHVAALAKQAGVLRVVLKHLAEVERVEAYSATKARMRERFGAYVVAHADETDVGDVESAARTIVDCVEAITMDALFDRGEALAEDPRVHELLRIARRYFLVRA